MVIDTCFLTPARLAGHPRHSVRESFKLVRRTAGLPWVGFHDPRKVYGHLADEPCRAGFLNWLQY